MNRNSLLLLLALALGSSAVAASTASPKPESGAAVHAPKPLLIPAAKPVPSAAKPPSKARSAPAKSQSKSPASKAQTHKAQVRKAPPAKSSVSPRKAVVRQAPKAKPAATAKNTKLAPVTLNLSLPPEMLKKIHFGASVADSNKPPLLPPLFVEEKPKLSPFQLSGKLIGRDHQGLEQDNYLDEVDGAEFSIEYRQ